jgi:hypothetical protein
MMHILIANDLTRDDLFAEMYKDDELWAELSQKTEEIIIYPRADGQPWRLSLAEVLNTLSEARSRLTPLNT